MRAAVRLPCGRNTPARAGTTATGPAGSARAAEHPRSRRDHHLLPEGYGHSGGTPPLAQGPQRVQRVPGRALRNTPARAGTTPTRGSPHRPDTEHPRSRRDHAFRWGDWDAVPGTPPLAQGPLVLQGRLGDDLRNTPARAGTTIFSLSALASVAEHPRSRRDHEDGGHVGGAETGTPPLAQGPLQRKRGCSPAARNTPARAGTTASPKPPTADSAEHPRSRRDHCSSVSVGVAEAGTPPLAQGPRLIDPHKHFPIRNTPARAGTTPPRR